MSRALIILTSKEQRDKASRWAQTAPYGTRVEFKETKRTLPQNSRFWAMLTDVSVQARKLGREHTPEQWRTIFMTALGHEMRFLPSLDMKSFIPLGLSSSDLSVSEMTDLMEFITAWGAENGITFNDPAEGSPTSSGQAGGRVLVRSPATSGASDARP